VFEKSTVSLLEWTNIPADSNFFALHIVLHMFSGKYWSVFSEQTVLEPLGPPPSPLKASLCFAIARADKTTPAVHGHVQSKDVTVFVKRLAQYFII